MQLPYSEELNIKYLGQLFRNTTECYKFFWFKAIVKKVTKGKLELTYEELVDEMIADAWYMVTEYHLNLGPIEKHVLPVRPGRKDPRKVKPQAPVSFLYRVA